MVVNTTVAVTSRGSVAILSAVVGSATAAAMPVARAIVARVRHGTSADRWQRMSRWTRYAATALVTAEAPIVTVTAPASPNVASDHGSAAAISARRSTFRPRMKRVSAETRSTASVGT